MLKSSSYVRRDAPAVSRSVMPKCARVAMLILAFKEFEVRVKRTGEPIFYDGAPLDLEWVRARLKELYTRFHDVD